jgi:hypothetical protein
VVGSVIPTSADAPHVRAKDQHGEQKENPHDFQPQRMANVPERTQKTGDAAAQTAAGTAGSPAGFAADGAGRWNRLTRRDLLAGLGLGGKALPGNAARNTNSDAEGAAYGFGSHP